MIDIDFRKLVALFFTFVMALIICALLGVMLGSCSRKVYVPVESVRRDTIKQFTYSVDTIMTRDSVYIIDKGDTVYYYNYNTEYKVKLKTDTAYIAKVDSVQVPYKVEVVKNKIPHGMWAAFFMMSALLVAALGYIKFGKKVS